MVVDVVHDIGDHSPGARCPADFRRPGEAQQVDAHRHSADVLDRETGTLGYGGMGVLDHPPRGSGAGDVEDEPVLRAVGGGADGLDVQVHPAVIPVFFTSRVRGSQGYERLRASRLRAV